MDIIVKEKSVSIGDFTVNLGSSSYRITNGKIRFHLPGNKSLVADVADVTNEGTPFANEAALVTFLEANLFSVGGGDGSSGVASISGTLVNNTDPANPVIGLPTWTQVSGKPTTFAPSAHTHEISDVNGLQTELNSKQDSSTALQIGTTATTAKAGNYQPTWGQVTGKPATFTPTQADILSYLLSLPGGDTAGNILTVNATADGVEWVTPA